MDVNEIVPFLLCKRTRVLPRDPVIADDGHIYERSELETFSKRPFYPSDSIKQLVEKLVSSGDVDAKYLAKCTGGLPIIHGEDLERTSILRCRKSEVVESINAEMEDLAVLMDKAKCGDTKCMIALGERYLTGTNGAEKDEKKAYDWFDKASDENDDLGTARKADCLLRGIGVEKDCREAYELLTLEDDSVHCMLRLWYYHSTGKYLKEDKEKANKAMIRVKKISPNLTEEQIRTMSKALMNLLNGETFKVNESTTTDLPVQSANVLLFENENTLDREDPTTTDNDPSVDNDNIVIQATLDHDSISEVTDPFPSQDEKGKAKEHIQPMPIIPEKSEATAASRTTLAAAAKSEASLVSASTKLPCKKCFECGLKKLQGGFTASQWTKHMGRGRCIECVSKCPQWQSSNITPASLQTKTCAACQLKKNHNDFSPNQWKRPAGTGRCRDCVSKGPQ